MVVKPTNLGGQVVAIENATATLTPSVNALSFASETVGTTSASQTVTFTNMGTAAVTVASVVLSDTTDFSIVANSCATTVAAGGKCQVSVAFSPAAAGSPGGTLTLTDNATNSPQTVSLSGTGSPPGGGGGGGRRWRRG